MLITDFKKFQSLSAVGLTKTQIKIYAVIAENPECSLKLIQDKTGFERRTIYDIVSKLLDRGLVNSSKLNNNTKYFISDTNKLKQDIKKKQEELEILEKNSESFNSWKKQTTKSYSILGNDAIKSLFEESLNYKEVYVMGGNSFENYTAVSQGLIMYFENWMRRRDKLKITMFDLVDHSTKLKGHNPSKYYKYKQLPEGFNSPMVLFMFGNKIAQIIWDINPFCTVIENEKIASSYKKYFDYFWNLN